MSTVPRYMDFLSGGAEQTPATRAKISHFVPNVVVMPTPNESTWHGLWAIDAHGDHEEVYGERVAVIAWAKERCNRVFVWSQQLRDLELLPTTL